MIAGGGGSTNNPLFQQLQLLLTGYAYNFYGKRETARADDLLVRERASDALNEGVGTLTSIEADFRRIYIPAATRENPFPPADALAHFKEIGRHKEKIKDLSVRIRSMSVPTQDRIWLRFRQEVPLLQQLLAYDYQMISATYALRDMLSNLSAESWRDGSAAGPIDQQLVNLDRGLKGRQELLQIPG